MCIGIALKMMSMLLCCCRKEFWCCLFRWLTMIQVGTNSRLFEALRMYLCKAAYRLKTAWIHNKESNNFQNLDYNTRSNEPRPVFCVIVCDIQVVHLVLSDSQRSSWISFSIAYKSLLNICFAATVLCSKHESEDSDSISLWPLTLWIGASEYLPP